MATAPAEDDKGTAGLPKKHDHQQAAHLDKVTDYVEEQEIKADMGKVGRGLERKNTIALTSCDAFFLHVGDAGD